MKVAHKGVGPKKKRAKVPKGGPRLINPFTHLGWGSEIDWEERLEAILNLLSHPTGMTKGLDLRPFDGVWPLIMWDLKFCSDSDNLKIPMDLPPDFIDQIDSRFMGGFGDMENPTEDGIYLYRVQGLPWKAVRCNVRMVLPHTARVFFLPMFWVEQGKKIDAHQRDMVIGFKNKHWRVIDSRYDMRAFHDTPAFFDQQIAASMGISALVDQIWRVYFAEDSIGITFPTDAVGAAAAFRLRDIPPGKSRRTALKHWVREHFRKKRNDPKELVHVCEHIRGADKFVWNGLHCKILPAKVDLERVAAARKGIRKPLEDDELMQLARSSLGRLPHPQGSALRRFLRAIYRRFGFGAPA